MICNPVHPSYARRKTQLGHYQCNSLYETLIVSSSGLLQSQDILDWYNENPGGGFNVHAEDREVVNNIVAGDKIVFRITDSRCSEGVEIYEKNIKLTIGIINQDIILAAKGSAGNYSFEIRCMNSNKILKQSVLIKIVEYPSGSTTS